MTDDFEALEAELAALRPCMPSADCRRHVAHRLTRASLWPWWLLGFVAVLAIAAIAFWPKTPPLPVEPAPPAAAPPRMDFDDSQPTVWDYRQALNRSPAALEELLDRPSAPLSSPEPIAAFPLFGSHSNPNLSQGDQ